MLSVKDGKLRFAYTTEMCIRDRYRNAFIRNDGERYNEFLNKVSTGEIKLNTNVLTPYEIITPFFKRNVSDEERHSINSTWNALEDYTKDENALAVIDGSGSIDVYKRQAKTV